MSTSQRMTWLPGAGILVEAERRRQVPRRGSASSFKPGWIPAHIAHKIQQHESIVFTLECFAFLLVAALTPSSCIATRQSMQNVKERVALTSMMASAALTIAKTIAGVMSGSLAILSEAGHSFIDF